MQMTDEKMTNQKMPRRLLWLILLIPILLTACANGEEAEMRPTLSPLPGASTTQPTSTPLPEGATTGARVRARGKLRVGVRYDLRPFGYVTEEGGIAGLGVDMGRELARRWLGDAGAVEFRQVRSDTAVEHIQAGDVDLVITAFIHTQERESQADFSLPYFIDGHALLVRAADAPVLGAVESLQGRPVGVVAWTDAAEALRAAVPFTLTFQTYERFDGAVAALERGEIDAVADLRRRLFWGRQMFPETAITAQYTHASVALAFPQNDPFFADLVNLTFQEMLDDGTYAELYGRWFPSEYPPAIERWPGDETPRLEDAPLFTETPDTIEAIRSRRRLAVAFVRDRSPFSYVDASASPAGYEVNLVQRLAGRWLGDSTALDFITTTVEAGQEMLRTGQADLLIGGVVHDRAAEMRVDFSLTTYWAGEGLMVWAGTPITDLRDLDRQPVAVLEESRDILETAAQEAGVRPTIMPQPTLAGALSLLEGGYVMAIVGDRADMLGVAYATEGLGVLPLRLIHVPLALALPPGDSAFRDLVNLTLLAMKADGELDALYATWFDDAPPTLESWPGIPYRPLRLDLSASPESDGG
ncbi:MAG TPA: transporter substrate-binding domain-containing protein [Chloroflexi bacterium]|nr:transporter substrate-binding domain-containing protein [Chloroflexota bacterium]